MKKIKELDIDKIVKICEYLKIKIKNKNKIFVCGNGGSAAITDHFVTDFNEYLKRKVKENIYLELFHFLILCR